MSGDGTGRYGDVRRSMDGAWVALARVADEAVRRGLDLAINPTWATPKPGTTDDLVLVLLGFGRENAVPPTPEHEEAVQLAERMSVMWAERAIAWAVPGSGTYQHPSPCNVCGVTAGAPCRPTHAGERDPGQWTHPERGLASEAREVHHAAVAEAQLMLRDPNYSDRVKAVCRGLVAANLAIERAAARDRLRGKMANFGIARGMGARELVERQGFNPEAMRAGERAAALNAGATGLDALRDAAAALGVSMGVAAEATLQISAKRRRRIRQILADAAPDSDVAARHALARAIDETVAERHEASRANRIAAIVTSAMAGTPIDQRTIAALVEATQ